MSRVGVTMRVGRRMESWKPLGVRTPKISVDALPRHHLVVRSCRVRDQAVQVRHVGGYLPRVS